MAKGSTSQHSTANGSIVQQRTAQHSARQQFEPVHGFKACRQPDRMEGGDGRRPKRGGPGGGGRGAPRGGSTEVSNNKFSAVQGVGAGAHLLSIVVPGALGRVTEDIVQHVGSVENIQLAAPPVAVMCQAILRHLQHQVPPF